MALYRISNLLLISRVLIVTAAIFSVVACIPTIQKIYHTPAVTGQVIDLQTLKPIVGAIVQHQQSGVKSKLPATTTAKDTVLTNQTGQYYLPSQSSQQVTTLMAGHAITDYLVRISSGEHSALVVVQASMKMLAEESTIAPLVILDLDPEVIAATPTGDYLDYKQLNEFLSPQGALENCDKQLAVSALTSLNTARKIYWQHSKESNIKPEILATAYNNLDGIWRYFQNSCDFGEADSIAHREAVFAARKITAQVNREITELSPN